MFRKITVVRLECDICKKVFHPPNQAYETCWSETEEFLEEQAKKCGWKKTSFNYWLITKIGFHCPDCKLKTLGG